jgi:ribose 5-phosphate isomerase B
VCPISDKDINEITERVLQSLASEAGSLKTERQSQITPLQNEPATIQPSGKLKVAIGTDHGGYSLKETLKPYLVELGYEVIDCGTNSKDAVDYPDFALAVASLVSEGKVWRGIMIDGAGIGSCIVANKVPGVRAASCHDYSSALNSREHNDANLLTLGAGLIGENLAKQIVKTWLTTEFLGGRHSKRVDKILAIERQFLKGGHS